MSVQPRVRHNDYGVLAPPPLGSWTPRLSVSVVVPAYGEQEKLDLTLAALRGQTYPGHLLEVIVVDDGSTPPLRLPELAPQATRLVVTEPGSRGRAAARNAGAGVADGDVVHWLDADVVCAHDQVEAQMRWHHLADHLVVKGYVRYVDFSPGGVSPGEVDAAVRAKDVEKLFDMTRSVPHQWIVDLVNSTRGLRDAQDSAYRLHVTNCASVGRALLEAAGPMDHDLIFGEDTELGYRLAWSGAVFVPEPRARSCHLGKSMMMRDGERVRRFNQAHVPDRIPLQRWQRTHPRRMWLVPLVEVVVDAEPAGYEEIRATVDGFLAGELHDLRVTLLAPWDRVRLDPRNPLDGEEVDLALLRELYRHESRVRFARPRDDIPLRAPYRLICPPGWVPAADTLGHLVDLAEEGGHGLVSVALAEEDDVIAARLERHAAFARARLVKHTGEEVDDVVEVLYGTHWVDGAACGFRPAAQAGEAGRNAGSAELKELRSKVAKLLAENDRLREELGERRAADVGKPPSGLLRTFFGRERAGGSRP
ncbi:glycosyltransferase [Streptosporangium sp. OZ121]|uniref:glycosyltransferase n=1 Tax=Streptosporangium sp. OZ121 TaxID=3444183 RepID=UPI003F7A1244